MKKWIKISALVILGLPAIIGGLYLYNLSSCRNISLDQGRSISFVLLRYGDAYSEVQVDTNTFLLENYCSILNEDLSGYDDFKMYSWKKLGHQQVVITGRNEKEKEVCLFSNRCGDALVH